jgi:hypothetical protein
VILPKGLSDYATSTLSPTHVEGNEMVGENNVFICGTFTSSSSCETNILKEEEACDRWRPNDESTSPRSSTLYDASHVCLMAKGEKVKPKSNPKPSPPSDISSSDTSYYSSDDASSDEEIDNIIKNLDSKTKLFITKLMEELESIQAELASREDTLIKQEDLYIASKEALALERSEVDSLHKALAKEQEAHAITKKAHIALKDKYCSLDGKHKELEEQYSILCDSNSHPSKANDASTSSTSQGCGKYYNFDLNIYSTNLANMEAMRKEIARLNEMIIDGLRHTKGAKTNGTKLVNGFDCMQSERKEQIGIVQPAQTAAVPHPKGSSAALHKNGKATNLTPDQTNPIRKMPKQNNKAPKDTKVQHQPKKTPITCFKCKKEGHHVRDCTLKKEEDGMSKIQEKKKMAHVKCSNIGHNASICFNKVDDQATLSKNKIRRSKRKCYGCNEKGHEIASCPYLKDENLASSRKRLISKVASKKQEEKANKNKSRICYTCREKGHLSMDCPMGNTPKLNSSIDSNMLRRPNDTYARKVIGSPCASTKAIWVPKSLVTNLNGPNIVWVPNCA